MLQKNNNKTIEEFVTNEISKQVNFCRKTFKLLEDWQPCVKLNFIDKKKESQAGRNTKQQPFMILELASFKDQVNGFLEYGSYSKNHHIGSFKSTDWKLCVTALISHELAHCVQFTLPVCDTELRDVTSTEVAFHGLGAYSKGHGSFFQKIYRSLRCEFVNSQIEPYCSGMEPMPVIDMQIHPLVGKQFYHIELGKCTLIEYNAKARQYPYVYMDSMGSIWRSSEEVQLSDFNWKYYD